MRLATTVLCLGTALVGQAAPPPAPYLSYQRRGDPPAALTVATPDARTLEQRRAQAHALAERRNPSWRDLTAREAELEKGLAPAFALVRDEIACDSYSGVLRGSAGTYATRAGNALDRAVLLARLLRDQGLQVRFARGALSHDRAQQLAARVFERRTEGPRAAPASAEPPALLARIRARASRDDAALAPILAGRTPTPEVDPDALRDELVDHFWVQAREGDAWVDLDPAFTDLPMGRAATTAEETYQELPTNLLQTVTVRVTAEMQTGEGRRSETLLEVTKPAVEWVQRQVFLMHQARNGVGTGIARALGDARPLAFAPTLVVDGEAETGVELTFGRAEQRGGVLDALGGDPATPVATDPAPVRAEWLEVEFAFPDGRRELTRRALLECEDGAPPSDADGPLCMQDVHNLVFHTGRGDVRAFAQAVAQLADETQLVDGDAPPAGAGGIETLWPFALQTMGWMLASEECVVPAVNDAEGVRLFADAPRLWIASLLHPAAERSEFVLDLRRDHLRGMALDPAHAADLILRQRWFGLLEGAFEHEVLAELIANAGGDPAQVWTTSARLHSGALAVLSSTDSATLADHVTSARAVQQIEMAFARGSLVVLPGAPDPQAAPSFWELAPDGALRAAYGMDWNGACARLRTTKGGGPFPKPSYRGGNLTSPVGRGGLGPQNGRPVTWSPNSPGGGRLPNGRAPANFGPKGGGPGGNEEGTLLINIAIPAAYAYFTVGLVVEVTAGYAVALLMDAGEW